MAKLSTPSHPCESTSHVFTTDFSRGYPVRRDLGIRPCRWPAYRRFNGMWLCKQCTRLAKSGRPVIADWHFEA